MPFGTALTQGTDYSSGTPDGVIPSPAASTNPGQPTGSNIVTDPGPPTANPAAGALLGRGSAPSGNLSSSTAPPATNGTSISGLGQWTGTGWSNSGFQGSTENGSAGGPNPQSDTIGGTSGGQYAGGGGAGGLAPTGFDDGGNVSDSGGAPSLDDALGTIKSTLAYGRAQNGIGPQQGGQDQGQQGVIPSGGMDTSDMRPSTNVEDDRDSSTVGQSEGPTPKMGGGVGPAPSPLGQIPQQVAQPYPYGPKVGVGRAATGAGAVTPSFADGGDVNDPSADGMPAQPQTNQPAPQPGGLQPQQGAQPPSKMVGYAMGADAVPPDMARALESRIDPQGTMDPSTKKMLAIASAPDQKTQWGLMQNYRQQFNAHASFARAAAAGSPTKPADMNAAAKAATDAFSNIPDGTSTTFQPTQGGVIAHVKHLAKGKMVQGHDDGGGVLPDPSQSQDAPSQPDQSSQDASIPLSSQQFQQVLSQLPYDQVMDHGAVPTLQKVASAGGQGDQTGAITTVKGGVSQTQLSGTPASSAGAQPQTPDQGTGPEAPGPQTTAAGRALMQNNKPLNLSTDQLMQLERQQGIKPDKVDSDAPQSSEKFGQQRALANDKTEATAANNDARIQGRLQGISMQVLGRSLQADQAAQVKVFGDQLAAQSNLDPAVAMAKARQLAPTLGMTPQQLMQMAKALNGDSDGGGGSPTPQSGQEIRYDAQGNAYRRGPDGKPVRVNQ